MVWSEAEQAPESGIDSTGQDAANRAVVIAEMRLQPMLHKVTMGTNIEYR